MSAFRFFLCLSLGVLILGPVQALATHVVIDADAGGGDCAAVGTWNDASNLQQLRSGLLQPGNSLTGVADSRRPNSSIKDWTAASLNSSFSSASESANSVTGKKM